MGADPTWGDRTGCSRGYVAWILVWTNEMVKSLTIPFRTRTDDLFRYRR
ncbi:hypothetical protein STANM337S_00192 [Streptomyces tanashiensis]